VAASVPGQAVLLVPLSTTDSLSAGERPRASEFSSESCRLWRLGLVPVSWGDWVNTLTAVALRSCVPSARRRHCPQVSRSTGQYPLPSLRAHSGTAQCPVPTHHDRQAAQPRSS
jgi:hypothetical protein